VVLMNMGSLKFKIQKGDRVCQLIIERCADTHLMESKELTESIRGDKGFGSSGVKMIHITTKDYVKKFRADLD
jgi:dUTPase